MDGLAGGLAGRTALAARQQVGQSAVIAQADPRRRGVGKREAAGGQLGRGRWLGRPVAQPSSEPDPRWGGSSGPPRNAGNSNAAAHISPRRCIPAIMSISSRSPDMSKDYLRQEGMKTALVSI